MPAIHDSRAPDYLAVWQCIGCGRIEMPQTCIGVCRDKKVQLIGKDAHERALAEIDRLQRLLADTRARLLRFAQCAPRAGGAERTFAALRVQLQETLAELPALQLAPHET